MRPPISRADLATILREADAAARRLHRRLKLPAADLDDLRQDLLIDLICRLPAFDARRGSIGAFAGLVMRNQSARIALRTHRARCAHGGVLLSLDAPAGACATPLVECLQQSDGLSSWHGQEEDALAQAMLRHDLAQVLGQLAPPARHLCAGLSRCPLRVLQGTSRTSRATLYRRLHQLRCEIAARGLAPRETVFRAPE